MAVMRWVVRSLALLGFLALGAAAIGAVYFTLVIRTGFAARDQPSLLEVRLARLARDVSIPSRARSLESPLTLTHEVLADALDHWADHCAVCHGDDGSGDTPIGRSLYPRPPDLRAAATQRRTDGELYYIIQNGVRLSGMPAWGMQVDDDRHGWTLVAFIRHLPELSVGELHEIGKIRREPREDERETPAHSP
jgi:hypothetical protein